MGGGDEKYCRGIRFGFFVYCGGERLGVMGFEFKFGDFYDGELTELIIEVGR